MAQNLTNINQRVGDGLIGLGFFGLALWLTTTDLTHFVTADEHNWIYRSGLFLHAIVQKNWAETSVWLTPAVTTTWLGSVALSLYYELHATSINQPFSEWLISFSKNKIDLNILQALREAMAVFTAIMVVLIYGLARKLWSRPVALLGILFLLTEPHLLSLSRIIGHDVPVAFFMTAALFSFIYIVSNVKGISNQNDWPRIKVFAWLVFSGIMGGLALLSKATALFLIPFVISMILVEVRRKQIELKFGVGALLIWGLTLWLTFILVWPAAWVNPLGQIQAVITNAFFYSAGLEEDGDLPTTGGLPNLGPGYYLINGAFKASPFLSLGLLFAGITSWLRRKKYGVQFESAGSGFGWLVIFAIVFIIFMTLGAKRSPRYILPVFPALALVAAWGWLSLFKRRENYFIIIVLGGLALLFSNQYAPYYFTYFNPLLGGAYTAPKIVSIGWGEGLDELGRWLNQQPEAETYRLGVNYTATIYPFYKGTVSSPVSEGMDYVAFYIKQTQQNDPAREIIAYFERQEALHHVILNGIDYAQVYRGPAAQLIETGHDLPLAYRPDHVHAPIGQPFRIDLLWPADFSPVSSTAKLTLNSMANSYVLEASAPIVKESSEVVISQHNFNLPKDMPRDSYVMLVNDVPVGSIKARPMSAPPDYQPVSFVIQNQIKLVGIKQDLHEEGLSVELAWQGIHPATNDYTLFIQLLDNQGVRRAGIDIAPERGFTTLDNQEIMLTHHLVPFTDEMGPGSYTLLMGLYYLVGDQFYNVGAVTLAEPVVLK
jgi:hypothetical protein